MKKSHLLVGLVCCIFLGLGQLIGPLRTGDGESTENLQWSEDTRLTDNPLEDWSLAIMQDAEGRLWLTWVTSTYTGTDILYKTFDTAWTSGLRITSSSLGDNSPSIMQDADGTIWAVWTSSRDKDWEIYYKTFDSSWSDDTRLTNNPGEDKDPTIFQDAAGTIWVAWSSFREDNYEIYYRTFDSTWSEDQQLTYSAGDDSGPIISQGADGTIWFFWRSMVIDNWEIHYRTFNGNWSEELQLYTNRQTSMSYSILQDTAGVLWVVWDSLHDNNYDIYYKTFNKEWSDDIQLTNAPGHDHNPSIFQDVEGTIWVVWDSERIFGNKDIYYKTFNGRWSDDIRLTDYSGQDVGPHITQDSSGTFWVFWNSERDENLDIYYKTGNPPVPWWLQLHVLIAMVMICFFSSLVYMWYRKFPVSFNRFSRVITGGKIVPFIKIRPNPYIAGNPVRSKKMFFGREDVFEFLSSRFETGLDVAIVLYGQRRTGKTSILLQIKEGRLGPQFIPVYIDIQGVPTNNDKEFLYEIAKKIVEGFKECQLEPSSSLNKFSEPNWMSGNNLYLEFGRFLDRCTEVMGDNHFIIMFDEYDLLTEKIEEKKISRRDMPEFFRSWMQTRKKFSFIFSGTRELEKIEDYWSLLFNSAVYKKIDTLRKKDALELMKNPVGGLIQYNDEAKEQILMLTSCHPYLLQFLLQILVDRVNEKKDYKVTAEDVDEIVSYSKRNPPPDFLYQWNITPDDQKTVLSLVAGFPADCVEIPLEEISSKVTEFGIEFTENNKKEPKPNLKESLKALEDNGVLKISRSGTSCFFRLELYRRWIAFEHPLSEFLEEID